MVNRMTLQGRLTREPENRQTLGGTGVATFTLAWSEKYKENERKVFLPCVAWGNQALFICRNFTKGSEMIVEGTLTTKQWKDTEGNNKEKIELIVEKVHFAGKKQENEAPQMPTIQVANDFVPTDDDVLPWDK